MISLAANLSFLFTEMPFLDRFAAAAAAGFRGVEWNFAYEFSVRELRARLDHAGLRVALLNTPAGDLAAGELGLAALPGRELDAAAAFKTALQYAVGLGAPCIHYLAGRPPIDSDPDVIDTLFLENLATAADAAFDSGITVTLEPLNAIDRPGYHLGSIEHAMRLIVALGRPNVGLQLDLYHCEMSGKDALATIDETIDRIAHVQIAGVPGRHEPSHGRLDFRKLLERLEQHQYSGWVGCEYSPTGSSWDGLDWASNYLWPNSSEPPHSGRAGGD
jgi:2-dehydrotetronate isomerase